MIKITVKEARNIREKVVGLIGKDKPEALMLKTHFGIHTFGLKFAIDVIILNNENEVVKLKKSLKPYNIFFWNPMYEKVLELPQGIIEKKMIKIGDKIDLQITSF